MSTYFGYVCKSHTPNLGSEKWFNWGDEVLTEAHRLERLGLWPEIPDGFGDGGTEPAPVDHKGHETTQPIYWLREHPNCQIALLNEYGVETPLHAQPKDAREWALSTIPGATDVVVNVYSRDPHADGVAYSRGYDMAMQNQLMSTSEQWHVSPDKWLARRITAFLEGRVGEIEEALIGADCLLSDGDRGGVMNAARAVITELTKLAYEKADG